MAIIVETTSKNKINIVLKYMKDCTNDQNPALKFEWLLSECRTRFKHYNSLEKNAIMNIFHFKLCSLIGKCFIFRCFTY